VFTIADNIAAPAERLQGPVYRALPQESLLEIAVTPRAVLLLESSSRISRDLSRV
jgi:hypothetical protein